MSEKLDQLKAKKAKIDQQIRDEKRRSTAAARREENKRKILLGAYVLEQSKIAGASVILSVSGDSLTTKTIEAAMDEFLTRDTDRIAFGLDPR